jgi:O-antigen/teichoic acid export membrane protein
MGQGLAAYAYNIFASYQLGPQSYGAVASLLNVLLVLIVLALGLQATAARRIATTTEERHQMTHVIVATSLRAALALSGICLLLSPALSVMLNLDSWWPAALIALAVFPLTLAGGQAGIFQGEQRWLHLGMMYLAIGLGRLVAGWACLLVNKSITAAMIGVALGALLPAGLGWWFLRGRSQHRPKVVPEESGFTREALTNSHALFAFFALTSIDIVIARSVFSSTYAGWYAGGVLLAKAVLFLPQFVLVVAFPKMSEGADARIYLKALAVISTLGLAAVLGTFLFPNLALTFVGGERYRTIAEILPIFAALGAALSMIQLLVYQVVAKQHGRSVWLLWAACTAVGASAMVVSTPTGLVAWVLIVDLITLAFLVRGVASKSSMSSFVPRPPQPNRDIKGNPQRKSSSHFDTH